MKRALVLLLLAGCASQTIGYHKDDPARVTCGCDSGDECWTAAVDLAKRKGENAETGEDLIYYSQCACYQGSLAGCNILGHFTKDWIRACERGDEVKDSCTIAGFVYYHGTRIPQINGPSFKRDPAAAAAYFESACQAGSRVACQQVKAGAPTSAPAGTSAPGG